MCFLCVRLCKTSTYILATCEKLFGTHSTPERVMPVQIIRRQASGVVLWRGLTKTRTGWCKLASLLPQETTSLQAQRENALLSFPFAVPLSLSWGAGNFWREVSVWRANMCESMATRKCIVFTYGKETVPGNLLWEVVLQWSGACEHQQILLANLLTFFGSAWSFWLKLTQTHTLKQIHTHTHTHTHAHTETHRPFDPNVSSCVSSETEADVALLTLSDVSLRWSLQIKTEDKQRLLPRWATVYTD